jgi:hypothetical protein
MLAQAFGKAQFDPSVTPSAHVCTAALSLAPPRTATDFTQRSWLHWNGFILNHDVLTIANTSNLNVDHLSGPLSDLYDATVSPNPLYANNPAIWYLWGTEIHNVNSSYLTDKVDEVRARLVMLISRCFQFPTNQ